MTTKTKATRKNVSFDGSDADQALLDAINTELRRKQFGSFGDLCKAALHQFLLSREPTQSVILFMELEREIAQLQSQFTMLEATSGRQTLERIEALEARLEGIEGRNQQFAEEGPLSLAAEADVSLPETAAKPADPLLDRLGPLLEDF